jgi:hypothetical protein
MLAKYHYRVDISDTPPFYIVVLITFEKGLRVLFMFKSPLAPITPRAIFRKLLKVIVSSFVFKFVFRES